MKRVVRVITVFILSLSVIVCSSFSVFAYYPVIDIDSSDWTIVSEDTYSAVYPDRINGFDVFEDYVYGNESLNGSTYYVTRSWDDNYQYLTDLNIDFPDYPSGSSGSYSLFLSGNTFYLVSGYDNFFHLCLNDDYLSYFSVLEQEVDVYTLSYPYSTWVKDKSFDNYNTLNKLTKIYSNIFFRPVWSDRDIYEFNGSLNNSQVVYKANRGTLQDFDYTLKFVNPISVLSGSLTVSVDSFDLNRLSLGAFAVLFNDYGFVCGMETGFLNYSFKLTVRNADITASSGMMSFNYDTAITDNSLVVGQSYIDSEFLMWDFPYEISGDVELIFDYTFVSDSYNLFFPGSIEFVNFEHYEDDMEHDEVMNAINDAANLIDGSIKSSASDLANEIASTYDKLVTSTVPKPDLSIDTGKVDNIVAEEEEILNNIYDDINSRTDEYLKVIGFSSIEGLFDEKINDLNNAELSASFDFVKSLFDQVISATGISVLVFFSLCFGFCIYVLGRRLS